MLVLEGTYGSKTTTPGQLRVLMGRLIFSSQWFEEDKVCVKRLVSFLETETYAAQRLVGVYLY